MMMPNDQPKPSARQAERLATRAMRPVMQSKRSATNPNKRPAITLMEVSVSTAAIVLCVALLGTSMKELRRESKDIRCLNNLGQIGAASMAFATQHQQEFAIPVHYLTGQTGSNLVRPESLAWGGRSGQGEPIGPASIVNSRFGTRFGRGPSTRPLNNILYKGFPDFILSPGSDDNNWHSDTKLPLDIYACPSDYGFTGSHTDEWRDSGLTSYDHYGNSYAANLMYVFFTGGPCLLQSNSPFLRSLSTVPNPSRTYLYIENAGALAWRQNYNDILDCSPSGTSEPADSIISGWHGRPFMFNMAFSDGHAGRRYINGLTWPSPHIGAYPPDGDGSEQLYNVYDCVIIRGADWQKDTLPAQPIRTSIPCFSPIESQGTSDQSRYIVAE